MANFIGVTLVRILKKQNVNYKKMNELFDFEKNLFELDLLIILTDLDIDSDLIGM